jgi:hypothetical protein
VRKVAQGVLESNVQIFTTERVAELQSVTVETVRDWIRRGDLEAAKKAGKWEVEEGALGRFLDAREEAKRITWEREPELLGKTRNGRWLLVSTATVWCHRQACRYCTAEGRKIERMRFRVEQQIRGDRVIERGRVICGRCYALVTLAPRARVHSGVWTSAPVMAKVGSGWTNGKPVLQLVQP